MIAKRYIYDKDIIKLSFPISLKKEKVVIPNEVPITPPIIIISPFYNPSIFKPVRNEQRQVANILLISFGTA